MMKPPPTGLESLHVLVIDDHGTMREAMWTILTAIGIGKVTEVADPAAAEREMRRFSPDIVFLNWGDTALSFVRAIRALPDNRNPFVPIMLVTDKTDDERAREARDAGVTEFLSAPLSQQAVAERLETILYHPRPFVRAEQYVGPDRRRQMRQPPGPERRSAEAADQPGVNDE
jgi:two-component system chemotaxis response regulator CheY